MFQPTRRLGEVEFIALMAALVSLTAFSIDAMLPAMGSIASDLSPFAPERAQLVIPVFALGLGLGTFFVGPILDAYGRRPVLAAGAVIYILAALVGWASGSLETLLAARFLQGIAAAVPRIAAMAVIRDLYAGRSMARIMSFILLVFSLVPALAPAMSAGLMNALGWRAVFSAFIAFAIFGASWFLLRQSETLPPEKRRPINMPTLAAGLRELMSSRQLRRVILAQACTFGMLFAILSSSEPIFDLIYDRSEGFPYWFGLVAVLAASASLLNARIVERLGMRRVVQWALGIHALISLAFLTAVTVSDIPFPIFLGWMTSIFFMIGLTLGNMNALGMEPFGHLAGLAASFIGAVATVLGGALAIIPTLAFNTTLLPVALAVLAYAAAGFFTIHSLGTGEIEAGA